MTSNLRDRRRQQTARDIQLAALRLSIRSGYDAITTDSIATEAGISPRTFFNYYANKQAAILGLPPHLESCNADWIVTSKNPLIDDLASLLGCMLDLKVMDRQVVRMIGQIWDTTPELMILFRNSMDNVALTIGGLLEARLGADRQPEAILLSELATHALTLAVRTWAEDETMTKDDIINLVRNRMYQVGALLA